MAGNIQKVNLKEYSQKLTEYTALQTKFYNELNNIRLNLNKITNYWTGKLVNSALESFNSNVEKLNTGKDYFKVTISEILFDVYNQYLYMEMGKPTDFKSTGSTFKFVKVPLTDESTIKFDANQVKNIVNNVKSLNTELKTDLKKLVSFLDNMGQYSDSLTQLKNSYNSKAAELIKTINSICDSVYSAFETRMQMVNTTEAGFNEADVKRAK